MREELLEYYRRELTFLRKTAEGFAEDYPKIAGRLLLEPGGSKDPHVERLIEAFAFIAARIHLKLDDEFPEITESLLQVMYPHYLSPLPAMSVAQFSLDPQAKRAQIDRHRVLYSKSSGGTKCRFRTCYPVSLWPIEVDSVRLETGDAKAGAVAATLTLNLKTMKDARFAEMAELDRLRFFLDGDSQIVHRVYEALFGHCVGIELRREQGAEVRLGHGAIAEVGFARDEGMLPYSSRSFLGYRLLHEYFHFPQKFLFFDVLGLGALRTAGFDKSASLVFQLDERPKIEGKLDSKNFLLGCTPIINLFQQAAEPIRLTQASAEYRVIVDTRAQLSTEVYAVDSVSSVTPVTGEVTTYQPFYSFRHSFERRQQRAFWHSTRRPSTREKDPGTEVFLTLVDLDFRPTRPAIDVLNVRVTATNRDLPSALPFRTPSGDLELEGAAAVRRVTCLMQPTRTVRPPLRHGAQWRLISHLSLNYLSPVEGGTENDPEVLQEILKLYDFSDSPAVRQQIVGLTGVSSRQVWRRIRSERGSGFGRGIEATLEFDESKYEGSGMFLFSSVLEKFLALYVSINSFSETIATVKDRGVLKRWPPRSGLQALL
jgi:type VI secretion system protein ImpG